MRSWLWKGMLAAAVAVPALGGAAWADGGCSDETLQGEYAFGVTTYTSPAQPNGPPEVVTGIKLFDGKGNLTQRDYQGDSGNTPFRTGEFGTYGVDADCTGSITIFTNGSRIDAKIVISDGGRHIHEVVSELQVPVGPGGVLTPVHPVHVSADDWKVGLDESDTRQ